MSYTNYQKWKKFPIKQEPFISVVIPAYNEEERIIPTIGAIASHISDICENWELIVADDGSHDQTVPLVRDLGFANLRVIETAQNIGKGHAVRSGMLAARGEYILFTDADNSTPIEEVDRLLHYLQNEKYDIAIGSRAVIGSAQAHKSFLRHLLSWGLRMIVQLGLHVGIKDTQCGFKLYSKDAARRLFAAQTLFGFSFDLEILYLAGKWGYKIIEVPVAWVDAPGSKVDVKKEVQRFIRDLARIRWNNLRGLYANG